MDLYHDRKENEHNNTTTTTNLKELNETKRKIHIPFAYYYSSNPMISLLLPQVLNNKCLLTLVFIFSLYFLLLLWYCLYIRVEAQLNLESFIYPCSPFFFFFIFLSKCLRFLFFFVVGVDSLLKYMKNTKIPICLLGDTKNLRTINS